MPAITNKQQLLTHAQTVLKKRFPLPAIEPVSPRPLLEELIFAICREGSTTADADEAFARVRKTFVDWNEIRVSTMQEVADVLRPCRTLVRASGGSSVCCKPSSNSTTRSTLAIWRRRD